MEIDGTCRDKEEPFDCSQLYFAGDECYNSDKCMPNCKDSYCQPCPEAGCGQKQHCDDAPVTTADPCTGLAEEACESKGGCNWLATVETCSSSTSVFCEDYLNEEDCSSGKDCRWNEDIYYCEQCEGADCKTVTTASVPDSGNACSTYQPEFCPVTRCKLVFDEATAEELCQDRHCIDVYEDVECVKLGCFFDDASYICYNKSTGCKTISQD